MQRPEASAPEVGAGEAGERKEQEVTPDAHQRSQYLRTRGWTNLSGNLWNHPMHPRARILESAFTMQMIEDSSAVVSVFQWGDQETKELIGIQVAALVLQGMLALVKDQSVMANMAKVWAEASAEPDGQQLRAMLKTWATAFVREAVKET